MAQDPGPVPERQSVPLRSSSVLPGSVQAAGRNGKPGLVVPGKAQIYPFCFLTINSLTLATFPVKGRCDDFSLSDESLLLPWDGLPFCSWKWVRVLSTPGMHLDFCSKAVLDGSSPEPLVTSCVGQLLSRDKMSMTIFKEKRSVLVHGLRGFNHNQPYCFGSMIRENIVIEKIFTS